MESITLYFKQGSSDKVYRASIEQKDGGFLVTFAYGRRGTTLTTGNKTPVTVTYDAAKAIYDKLIREKTAKGYTPGEDGTCPHRGAGCFVFTSKGETTHEQNRSTHRGVKTRTHWTRQGHQKAQSARPPPRQNRENRRRLLKITKNCEKNDSILVGAEEKASVSIEYAVGTQLAKAKVNSLPVEEFPPIPTMKGEPTPLNDALRLAIHEAIECASTDATRLVLNGAYLDLSKPKAHYVVGTDGRHLFSSNSFNLPLKDSLIIPSHKFIGWKEFNHDGELQLKIAPAEKKDDAAYLQLSSRRWRFITRQIEGNYPNWRQAIPDSKSSKTTLTFDSQGLKPLITTIEKMPCHDAVNLTIGLEWKAGKLHLVGKAASDAEWMKVPVEVKGTGPDISIYLNRHLLTKAFGFGLNTVELIDPISPLRFHQGGRQMIVAPLRPDVGNPSPQPAKKDQSAKAEAPQPAASPQAAQPTEGNTTMPKSNGNQPPAEKPTLEKALADIEKIKGSYRDAIRGLNDLGDMLKAISKERKSTEKEVQSVRSTLEKLQSVRL